MTPGGQIGGNVVLRSGPPYLRPHLFLHCPEPIIRLPGTSFWMAAYFPALFVSGLPRDTIIDLVMTDRVFPSIEMLDFLGKVSSGLASFV